jgi:hypothetical protein
MTSSIRHLLAFTLTLLLAACGGGGKTSTGTVADKPAANDPKPDVAVTQKGPETAEFVTRPAAGAPPPSTTVVDTTALSLSQNLPTGPNGNRAAIGTFSTTERDRLLSEGLKIWRAPRIDINGISKGACSNCHSADGFELAEWNFHDDDVRRRAHIDGVNAADREVLVNYFAALRQKYGITSLKSIMDDRPFQPGGQPFVGATSLERDYAFVDTSLRSTLPSLFGSMDTVAKAVQARAEIKASNPLEMRIGVPFPRISEDCFRGIEHCSLNDWMADLPQIPKADKLDEWFKINDAYIANPTDENLRAVLTAVGTLTDGWRNPSETDAGPSAGLGFTKFKSMQILQHFLRKKRLGQLIDPEPLASVRGLLEKRPNAPFLVGDWSFDKFGEKWTQPNQMPTFVRKSLGESSEKQLTGITPTSNGTSDVEIKKAELSNPWWYVGFVFDSFLGSGTGGEYFLGNIGQSTVDPYPFHRYYAIARNVAVNDKLRQSNRGTLTPTQIAALNVAMGEGAWRPLGEEDIPRVHATVESRILYRRLEMNWLLMTMLLEKEQLQKSGIASFNSNDIDKHLCSKDSLGNPNPDNPVSLRNLVIRAISLDGARAEFALKLYNEINTLAGCGFTPLHEEYAIGAGTGLNIEWRRGSGDALGGNTILTTLPVIASRVEPIIDFPGRETGTGYFATWAKSQGFSVNEGGNGADSSAIGTGFIVAPVTGDYKISMYGNGIRGKLFVNNVLVSSSFAFINDGATIYQNVSLVKGQKYPIRIERHGYAGGGIQLSWSTTNGKVLNSKIPASQFSVN